MEHEGRAGLIVTIAAGSFTLKLLLFASFEFSAGC